MKLLGVTRFSFVLEDRVSKKEVRVVLGATNTNGKVQGRNKVSKKG